MTFLEDDRSQEKTRPVPTSGPGRWNRLRGEDLSQRPLASTVVGRCLEREVQRRLLGDLEARELSLLGMDYGCPGSKKGFRTMAPSYA